MKKLFFAIISLLFANLSHAFADDLQFTAKANRAKVGTNEVFSITYSINQGGAEFSPPDFRDFRSLGAPQQGHNRININGAVTENYSITFHLQAVKEGTFTIKPATIKLNGRNYQCNEVKVEVVKGAPQQQQQPSSYQQQTQQPEPDDFKKNIFLRAVINKEKAYIGEQLYVVYKLYHRVNLVKLEANKLPELSGFWSEVIDKTNQNEQLPVEVIDGVRYHVAEVHKMVLMPQKTGSLEITPLQLDAIIRVMQSRGHHPIFDFFGGGYEDVSYTFASKPIKVKVLPFPDSGKPKSFNGAVGSYSIEANLDKTNVKAHEAINLKFTINGKGNLPLIETPAPTFPADFEVYDPKLTDKTSTTASGVAGTRTFEYLIIPRHAGKFSLEPFEFSYFDPATGNYKTLMTGSFEIEVSKNDQQDNVVISAGRRQEEIKLLGSDIRFIQTTIPTFVSIDDIFFGSSMFYLFLFLPMGLFGGFLLIRKKQQEINSNPLLVKSKKANKKAIKSLSIAKTNLEKNNLKTFYEEVYKALYEYISDKINVPVAGLDKDKITAYLSTKSVSAETIQKLHDTIARCEMARFALVNDNPASQIYSDAVSIITKIEEEVK